MTLWTVRLDVPTNTYQDIEADTHLIGESGDLVFSTENRSDNTVRQSHSYARGRWISVVPTFKSS